MDHKHCISVGITLFLVILIAAGCTSANVAPPPTSAPACPTAPVCPTTAAIQIPIAEKTWFSRLQGDSVIEITFDPGDKCTVKTVSSLPHGMLYYHIKVNDQAHATYAVLFQTLDEGKTVQDLQAYSKTATNAPSFSHSFLENYVGPGTSSYYAETFSAGLKYISCFISTKTGILRILDFGPVEIKE